MQFKSVAALLLASMAIAAPAEVDSRQDSDLDELAPGSILSVVATAVPLSFWAEATNTAAFESRLEQGIVSNSWPSWYSSLPDSVKEYFTSAISSEYPSLFSVSATATPTSPGATTTGTSSSGSTTDSTTLLTGSSTSPTPTGSETPSSSGSLSSTTSGAPESTTLDDGAAPTGVTLGLAGAAGLLGLAVVL